MAAAAGIAAAAAGSAVSLVAVEGFNLFLAFQSCLLSARSALCGKSVGVGFSGGYLASDGFRRIASAWLWFCGSFRGLAFIHFGFHRIRARGQVAGVSHFNSPSSIRVKSLRHSSFVRILKYPCRKFVSREWPFCEVR